MKFELACSAAPLKRIPLVGRFVLGILLSLVPCKSEITTDGPILLVGRLLGKWLGILLPDGIALTPASDGACVIVLVLGNALWSTKGDKLRMVGLLVGIGRRVGERVRFGTLMLELGVAFAEGELLGVWLMLLTGDCITPVISVFTKDGPALGLGEALG